MHVVMMGLRWQAMDAGGGGGGGVGGGGRPPPQRLQVRRLLRRRREAPSLHPGRITAQSWLTLPRSPARRSGLGGEGCSSRWRGSRSGGGGGGGRRFRLDLATLKEGDLAGAQAAKEALENRQRHDARTRKEANPALH